MKRLKINSLLHMLVDGLCAWAMFGRYIGREQGYLYILLYNFCAFALQMPLGLFLDVRIENREEEKKQRICLYFAAAGILLTVLGAFSHPVILGLGNALFHVGGGVSAIREDREYQWGGRGLGIFVAPGAFGLFLGGQLADPEKKVLCTLFLFLGAALLWVSVGLFERKAKPSEKPREQKSRRAASALGMIICCFVVVILRSYVGMAVAFPWKKGFFAAFAAVMMVVLGKVAGGFLGEAWGTGRASCFSLIPCAVLYLVSGHIAPGLLALFLFNMTMPITLYLLAERFPDMAGFFFGVLTFGLFLGFLPVYLKLPVPADGRILGALGSLLTLLLLLPAIRRKERKDV